MFVDRGMSDLWSNLRPASTHHALADAVVLARQGTGPTAGRQELQVDFAQRIRRGQQLFKLWRHLIKQPLSKALLTGRRSVWTAEG